MTDSKRVAGLLGPSLIAITLSEMMNAHIWAAIIAPVTYLAGALWFVAGLSIIRAHNKWRGGWPVIVTLVGWFAILGGLFRMFAPEVAQQGAQNTFATFASQLVLLAAGIFLTFRAYGRELRQRIPQ